MKSKILLSIATVIVLSFSIMTNIALLQATQAGSVAMLSIMSVMGLACCVFIGKAWADYA